MDRKKIEERTTTMANGRPVSWEINDNGTDGVEIEIFSSDEQSVVLSLLPQHAEELALGLLKAAAANRITYKHEQDRGGDDPNKWRRR